MGKNIGSKLDGNVVIHMCMRCRKYKYPACQETGEVVRYPVSGPVGVQCPLPDYVNPGGIEPRIDANVRE